MRRPRGVAGAGRGAHVGRSAFADAGLTGATIGVLALVSAINALSTSAYLPALPTVARDLGASTSGTQLTLTSYLLGVALGQLTWGPLSDGVGRRRPLLWGLSCYIAASLLCAAAPSIELLLVFRAVQGWSACAGQVLSRSVVADHARGTRMAQLLTLLLLMGVIAPVAAPLIGSWLLLVGSWRTVFVFLAAMGMPMVVGVLLTVDESLPRADRRRGGLVGLVRTVRGLLANRRFTGYAVALGSAFATMFVFMSAAPFLFQSRLGLSAQEYGWVNAGVASGLGLAMALVHRHLGRQAANGVSNPAGTARAGIVALLVGTGCVLAASLLDAPLVVWVAVLCVTVASLAPIAGSTMSLALGESSHAIGTGTAVIGMLQALLGALAAPLVGLGGPEATLPMALTMVGASTVSGVAFLTARRLPQNRADATG